jgi:DNA-binding XRE family transcriptional regulator
MTQVELAQVVGVSDGAVKMWETGRRTPDRRAQAILQKLRNRVDEEGPSVAQKLLALALGGATFMVILSALFEE